jgi:hypothetical protein
LWSKWELVTKDVSVVKLQPGIIGRYINNVLGKKNMIMISRDRIVLIQICFNKSLLEKDLDLIQVQINACK